MALSAFGFSVYLETITVVDEDVHIQNIDVLINEWAVTTRCNPSEQVHIIPEVKAHRNHPIAGVRELPDGGFVGKSKMIVDATVPWKYKNLKGKGEFPLFKKASFLEVDLKDYVSGDDYRRWIK